jgi:hypothetical protein
MTTQRFKLISEDVKRNVCRQITAAEWGKVVTIADPTRSSEANARMWAQLADIAKHVDWYGNKLTPEEWKDVFSAALKRQKVIPGLDGGFVVCGQRTSKMSKREMSDLIELMNAFCVERGVKLTAREWEMA